MQVNNNQKNIVISIDLDKDNLDKINQVVINISNGKLTVNVINNNDLATDAIKADIFEEDIDNKLIAVLSAAAYAVLRKPIRLKRVSFLSGTTGNDTAWTRMGVLSEISAHNNLR